VVQNDEGRHDDAETVNIKLALRHGEIVRGVWGKAKAKTEAGPSTHHPRAEERSGPLSLRMTRF
jgi:hypothetical protein